MATIHTSSDGVLFDFSHDEVNNIETAEDVTATVLGVIGAALQAVPALGPLGNILGLAAAAIAATIALHKIEFQHADQGNGTEAVIPWWAVVFNLWGVLIMKPLPHKQDVGPNVQVACATNAAGDLHVCVIDAQRGLWHTIRRADGSWPSAFGDVNAQVGGLP